MEPPHEGCEYKTTEGAQPASAFVTAQSGHVSQLAAAPLPASVDVE